MLAEISIVPIGNGESLSQYVSEVVKYINLEVSKREYAKREIKFEVTSMSTIIEGGDCDIWEILRGCHETMKKYSDRVYTIIKIDDRKGEKCAILKKKSKIERLLAKK